MKFKTEEKKVSVNEEPEVRYAYVVFKNMDGKDLVMNAYKTINWKEKLALKYEFFKNFYFKNDQERLKKLQKMLLFKKLPKIETACTPTNINWQNLGYTYKNRTTRTVFNWCVTIIMILLALMGIAIAKSKTDVLN